MTNNRGRRRRSSVDPLQTPPKSSTITRNTRSGASYSKSTSFKPTTPSTTIKRPRSSSSTIIVDENGIDANKITPQSPSVPPTTNKRLRSSSFNPVASISNTNTITNKDDSSNPLTITSPPKKQQWRRRNKRAVSVDNGTNSIAGLTASTNATAEINKQVKNTRQAAVNKSLSSIVEEVESDDPDSSEDDYVEGSESEPEELGDDKDDEREDVDTVTNGSIHINAAVMLNDGSKSLQADERLLSNRGLPKTVDYEWLIGKLINEAVDSNKAEEKAKGKGKGKGKSKATFLSEQELEFVRKVDESSHGHADNTQAAYKSTYRPYMDFCDAVYAVEGRNRYEVDEIKTARFLKEKLFPQSTQRNIPTHIVKDTKVFMYRQEVEKYGIPITGQGIRGTFDFALYLKEIEKEKANMATKQIIRKATTQDNGKATMQDKDGTPKPTKVFVPYGVSRINQAYSAIIHLWTLQTSTLQQRSEKPAIRPSSLIDKTIDTYRRSLVGGILRAEHVVKDAAGNIVKIGREVTTDSYATNYYSVYDHIKCLLYTWQQPVGARSAGIREHFNLAVRHAMLLRDEDLRRLNIANCTIDTLEQRLGGTQPIMAMVFSIHGGKTSQHGIRQEGIAIRHYDVRRCSVGAMAFYMYERFQMRRETWPSMNDAAWTGVKLLTNGAGSDKYGEISYSANRASTMDVFIANNISCSNITHSGRHSGAKECVRLNIPEEDIRTGGRWIQNTGKMQQFYLQKRPTQWALAIAGFRDKPFHLARNEVNPTHALQEMIFPFIETLIGGAGTKKNRDWRKECIMEMDQFDPNNTKELETVLPEPLVSLPKSESTRRPTVYRGRSNVTYVLRLMLRFRRVLLQDAAVLLYLGEKQGFRSPLLETSGSVFSSVEFLSFQKDVIAAVTVQRVVVPRDIPDNMLRALEAASQNQASDMQVLAKLLSAVNDNVAQQSSQSVWANNMLASLAGQFLKQQEQLRVQAACIQTMQEAMDSMARHQRLQAPIPGYSGQPSYFGFSGVPNPGWLPPSGRNSGNSPSTPNQKQSKSVKDSMPVAIRPFHPGSASQDLPSAAAPSSSSPHSSELELLLMNRPKNTRPSETPPPEHAVQQPTGAGTGKHTSTQRLPPTRDDWFKWSRDHKSTKSIYDECLRYESELAKKLEPTGGKSKHRGKLTQRLADDTERHVSNIRRVAKEVDNTKKRFMQDDALPEDEALLAAFDEFDALVKFRSRSGHYSCNQAVELCTDQMRERGELRPKKKQIE